MLAYAPSRLKGVTRYELREEYHRPLSPDAGCHYEERGDLTRASSGRTEHFFVHRRKRLSTVVAQIIL